jgi:hypothetical protein
MRISKVLFAALLLLPFAAHADDDANPVSLDKFSAGARLGTLGIGPDVDWRPESLVGVRADAGFFGFDENFHAGRVEYNGNVHLESYGLTADVYPFMGAFRVSAGARLNENDLRAQSAPGQALTFGSVTLPASSFGTVAGKVTFDKFSPYLGFGWDAEILPHLMFTSDLGVMFNGNPKASVIASGPAAAIPGSAATVAGYQQDVQNAVNGYAYYPVLEIGLAYKF